MASDKKTTPKVPASYGVELKDIINSPVKPKGIVSYPLGDKKKSK